MQELETGVGNNGTSHPAANTVVAELEIAQASPPKPWTALHSWVKHSQRSSCWQQELSRTGPDLCAVTFWGSPWVMRSLGSSPAVHCAQQTAGHICKGGPLGVNTALVGQEQWDWSCSHWGKLIHHWIYSQS